jgi:hypothetical protein
MQIANSGLDKYRPALDASLRHRPTSTNMIANQPAARPAKP